MALHGAFHAPGQHPVTTNCDEFRKVCCLLQHASGVASSEP